MKHQAIAPAKHPAINETSIDDLFQGLSEWSNRIAERAYEFFAASGFTNGHDREDWLKAEQELLKPIACEVTDAGGEVIVKAEVPGLDAQDLDVRLNGSHLVIAGRHDTSHEEKENNGNTFYLELKSRQVYRMIELPASVTAEHAQAELENGVLELKLRKAEKPQKIEVTAA